MFSDAGSSLQSVMRELILVLIIELLASALILLSCVPPSLSPSRWVTWTPTVDM